MINQDKPKQVISVIGMHRSGTSCVARSLKALGVCLGEHLEGPSEDNPKGFWEDQAIVSINNFLLQSFDLTWDTFVTLPLKDLVHHPLMEQAICLLNNRLRSTPLFGFKDPRTTRLLYFWQHVFSVLDVKDSYIIAIRNPLHVAYSLKKRDGFEMRKSLLLWLVHTLSAINMTHEKKRIVVDYGLLLSGPLHQLKRIAAGLALSEDHQELFHYADHFLDQRLSHYEDTIEALRKYPPFGTVAEEVYQWLLEVAADNMTFDHPYLRERLQVLTAQVNSLEFITPYLDQLQYVSDEKEKKIQALQLKLLIASSSRTPLRNKGKALFKKIFRKQ